MANIISKTSRGEYCISTKDYFMNKGKIFLQGDITPEMISIIIRDLFYINERDDIDTITIYIDSPGGDVTSGMELIDVLKLITKPIKTVCIAEAYSMAGLIFLTGTTREMFPHSRIMLHAPMYGYGAEMGGKKPDELREKLNKLIDIRMMTDRQISALSGKSMKEVKKITDKDSYYNAEEAIAEGFATGIATGI